MVSEHASKTNITNICSHVCFRTWTVNFESCNEHAEHANTDPNTCSPNNHVPEHRTCEHAPQTINNCLITSWIAHARAYTRPCTRACTHAYMRARGAHAENILGNLFAAEEPQQTDMENTGPEHTFVPEQAPNMCSRTYVHEHTNICSKTI